MSQEEIIEVLEKREEATAQELADLIGISIIAIRKSLWSMLGELEVEKIVLTKEEVEEKGIRFSGRHFVWRIKND